MRRLLSAAVFLLLCSCPTDVASALRQYGFVPVRPASSLWRPGSMIFIRSRSPFEVGFICTASQMMGADYAPLESMTTNADLAKASKRGFTMQAQIQDIVAADAELQNIKSVKTILRNVKVFEVSDYDVMSAIRKPNNRCMAAIARRRAQGFEVAFIAAAIQADVLFSVSWERTSKLDVQAKVAAVQNLSAKLGVDASATSDKSIQAKGLIWGIRDDSYLAYQFDPRNLPAVQRGSRIIDPDTQTKLEALLGGTEPRSWPATPTEEAGPFHMAPIEQATSLADAEREASVPVSSPTAVVAAPPLQAVTDVPAQPDEATPAPAPPTAPQPAAPMTQEEWDALVDSQGSDEDS